MEREVAIHSPRGHVGATLPASGGGGLMKRRDGDPEEAGMSAERMCRLTQLAKGWVDQGMTPSLVVLVARKGVIVLHEAFGKLTPESDSPPLPKNAIYP